MCVMEWWLWDKLLVCKHEAVGLSAVAAAARVLRASRARVGVWS